MRSFVRRFIYNRWSYAGFAAVCLLDAVSDTLDLSGPCGYSVVDVLSLIASCAAALFALLIFFDLQSRGN
jgi:hypothetical protein